MQDCVTHIVRKKIKKSRLKPVIFGTIFFLLIFLISGILVVSKRSNVCFYARSFYFVYADKNRDSNLMLSAKDQIKKLGGAGVFIEKNYEHYLVVSVYSSKDDAKGVASGLEVLGKSASVVDLTSKEVSKKYQNLLKQNQNYFDLFNYLFNFQSILENLCFSFAKGELSEGKLMSSLVEAKLEIQKLVSLCESENIKDLKPIINSAGLVASYIDNAFDKFFSATSKESVCYELGVRFVVCYIELCDNLQ